MIITVINQKGGSGKSTTVNSLAVILSVKFKKKVLIIDFDPQGNLSTTNKLYSNDFYYGSHSILQATNEIQNAIQTTSISKLDIIPTDIRLKISRDSIPANSNKQLKLALSELRHYDYILIDCSPALDLLSENAIYAADKIIVPIAINQFSLDGFDILLSEIERVRPDNSLKGNIKLLPTMYNASKTRINTWIMQELQNWIDYLFDTTIRQDSTFINADLNGKTIIKEGPNSKAVTDYTNLAKEIMNYD